MTRKAIPDGLRAFFSELGEDVIWHGTRLVQSSLDLVTLAVLGTLIYLSSFDPASAGLKGRPMFGVQARADGAAGVVLTSSHAPTSCGLTNDLLASDHRSCITAMVLEPSDI